MSIKSSLHFRLSAYINVFKEVIKYPFPFIASNIFSILGAITGGISIGMIIPLIEPNSKGLFVGTGLEFLDNLLAIGDNMGLDQKVRTIAIFLFGLASFEAIMSIASGYISSLIQMKSMKEYQNKILRRIKDLDLLSYLNYEQGKLFSLVTHDSQVASKIIKSLVSGFQHFWMLIIYLIVLFKVSFVMTTVAFISLGIISNFVNGRLGKRLKKRMAEVAKRNAVISGELSETLDTYKYVKASGKAGEQFERLEDLFENWRLGEWEVLKVNLLPQPIFNLLNSYAISILLITGTYLFPDGSEEWLGLMVPFLLLVFRLLPTVSGLNGLRIKLEGGSPYFERINTFFDASQDVQIISGNKDISSMETPIKFENVTFTYPNSNNVGINKVSFTVNKNSLVALIGPSGGGKSTIADLLLRLYDPISGEITLNESNIRDFKIDSYRKRISYVSQDTFIFNRTVLENIKWFSREATDDEVLYAAKQAHADKFIEGLINGYDTFLGQGGVQLSGGQKQRIALARAILKDSDLVILDEATSNLDVETELEVYKGINNLLKTKSVIAIAHRLSTIQNASEIILVDGGEISVRGTHNKLIQESKYYNELLNTQDFKIN